MSECAPKGPGCGETGAARRDGATRPDWLERLAAANRALRERARRAGLDLTGLGVLEALARADAAMTVSELAEALATPASNVSPAVARLDAAGLVAAVRSGADRRRVCVSLTKTGRARLDAARDLGR